MHQLRIFHMFIMRSTIFTTSLGGNQTWSLEVSGQTLYHRANSDRLKVCCLGHTDNLVTLKIHHVIHPDSSVLRCSTCWSSRRWYMWGCQKPPHRYAVHTLVWVCGALYKMVLSLYADKHIVRTSRKACTDRYIQRHLSHYEHVRKQGYQTAEVQV